ncbi:hypothetical protein Lal_00030501 [Lupinus albus]|nr:hypothetical protein Lal_00030501 [Lupinus albus]
MSKPSNFPQRPSPIIVQRKKNKNMMCLEEQLTRELSNISNEGYHGGESASVPFVWESEPGTPKVRVNEIFMPPLTPPPSYQQKAITKKTITKAKIKNSPKATSLFQTIFPKRGTKKPSHEAPPLSNSSSSSSLSSSSPRRLSYSAPSSPMTHSRKGEEEDLYDVPRSSLCFGYAGSRGFYSSMFKKVLLGDFM